MTESYNDSVCDDFMLDNDERRKSMFATNVALLELNSVFSLTATFQNVPVVYAILRTPTLHNPPNILLCSLAFTDLFVGCMVQPLSIAHTAVLISGKPFSCTLWRAKETLLLLFMYVSMVTLVTISTERWLALHYHLRYHQIVTVRRTLLVIAITWFSSTTSIIAWPLGLDFRPFTALGLAVITIAAIVLVFMYVRIFLILRRHRSLIENQAKLHPPSVNIRKHRKSSATMFYVVVLFFIFYSPTFYAMIKFLDSTRKVFSVDQTVLWEVAKTAALINSSANPLMYYWRMREIRRAVRSLFSHSSVLRIHVGDATTPASGSRENEWKGRTDQRQSSFSVKRSSQGNVSQSNVVITKARSDMHQDHRTESTKVEVGEKKLFLMPRFLEPGPSFQTE